MWGNTCKILILKCLLWITLTIGKTITFFRGQKHIDLASIDTIILNRRDRIGDAIITKPFILVLSRYIKEELRLNIDIQILTSNYNDFIFTDTNNGLWYTTHKEDIVLQDYGPSFFTLFSGLIQSLLTGFRHKRARRKEASIKKNTVFVDMIGDRNAIHQKYGTNAYYISCNLLLNNFFLDYALKKSYVGLNSDTLIQSYITLFSGAFQLPGLQKYIEAHLDAFYPEYCETASKENICIFVGNKVFRNFSPNMWKKIIHTISTTYPNEKISVIDDPSNTLAHMLQTETFGTNVTIHENTFSLQEFQAWSANFKLIIGGDGGGMNCIRTSTNSITLYTLGNYRVWSPYTGALKWNTQKIGKNYILKSLQRDTQTLGYFYKNHFLCPPLDYEISKTFFDDFPAEDFAKSIQAYL